MLNKKAIAALAAGATLVSGLAFAAPAMAEAPATPKTDQTTPKTDQTTPKTDQTTPKTDQTADSDDNYLFVTETAEELDARLAKEKAEKEAKAKAEDEKDKSEHSPFGNKDMDYKKCVKLYGEDSLECKAVADYLKRHGQKVNDKADVKKSDKKADKKAADKKAAPLAKTGAAVALAAVAASVLAGMGAALRKIRH
ncbi:peptidase [Gardnerella greenwoodii]|uniref:peptidase n=1 Tax=Gardnerella greenwoodii TaxID=2914925 RepID=UPI0039EFA07F